ncbi:MAG: NAD(P)/FAD-dependent oxidoreductase [Malacoplasma sp.]|nr:NAD(P)/FAD-dependent oxidoreductase [Malacoplasma sp.]
MTNLNDIKTNLIDVAIIGAGAGGIYASTMAHYFKLKNIVLEKNEYIGGQPIEIYPNKFIYDFPCFYEIKSSDVIKKLLIQNQTYNKDSIKTNVEIFNISVVKFEQEQYFYFQTSYQNFYARNIIIATGNGFFKPRKLEINNVVIDSKLIHYVVGINTAIYQNKKIVILGGGDSAVEWANYFAEEKISCDVSIVHRRNEYRSSSFMIQSLEKNKIKQYLNYEIIDFNEINQNLIIKHKESNEIKNINFDFVFVQYGQIPSQLSINLFDQIEKEKGKYKVDLNQKTNIKNIYAIGDASWFLFKPMTILSACNDAMKAIYHIVKNKEETW